MNGETSERPLAHDADFDRWWYKLQNAVLKVVLGAGVKMGPTYLLAVIGRKTGTVHSTPVIVVETNGERYLVAPYGPVNWVRNARAAGSVTLARGGHSEALHIVELGPEESAPVLKKYVGIASATRRYFDARPDSPVEDFVAEAQEHPVFRLVA